MENSLHPHSSDEAPLWYALQVAAKKEDIVAQLLLHKGYEQYVPMYTDDSQRNRKNHSTLRKLFPGYVFCKFSYAAKLQARAGAGVVTTPGVIRIVGGTRPAPIPTEEIEAIRMALAAGVHTEPWPFEMGQKVRIQAGPLRGVSGIVVRADGKHRMIITIDLLHRAVAVTIESAWLTPHLTLGHAIDHARTTLRNAS
ncbi:MAG: transcriptional activator RfaH [Acidobacteriaceae bacterium]|nr:transcriptional activator RfaH [Acidobacteriaceae bacterium]